MLLNPFSNLGSRGGFVGVVVVASDQQDLEIRGSSKARDLMASLLGPASYRVDLVCRGCTACAKTRVESIITLQGSSCNRSFGIRIGSGGNELDVEGVDGANRASVGLPVQVAKR